MIWFYMLAAVMRSLSVLIPFSIYTSVGVSSSLEYIAVPLDPVFASLWCTVYPGIGGILCPLTFIVSLIPITSGGGYESRILSFIKFQDVFIELTLTCHRVSYSFGFCFPGLK